MGLLAVGLLLMLIGLILISDGLLIGYDEMTAGRRREELTRRLQADG